MRRAKNRWSHQMKKLNIVVTLIYIFAISSILQAQSFLTNGLVVYYPFNGNANDTSGNRNDGTLTGDSRRSRLANERWIHAVLASGGPCFIFFEQTNNFPA
jgi:hypothetical protein